MKEWTFPIKLYNSADGVITYSQRINETVAIYLLPDKETEIFVMLQTDGSYVEVFDGKCTQNCFSKIHE